MTRIREEEEEEEKKKIASDDKTQLVYRNDDRRCQYVRDRRDIAK